MNTQHLQEEWAYKEYVNRENLVIHAPYEPEMNFYYMVASGNKKEVLKQIKSSFLQKEGLGRLSENDIRNGIYHFIVSVALIARECIKMGLPLEEAYSLSDFYIQKVDTLTSLKDITDLHDDMVLAYTNKMFNIKKDNVYSKPVIKSINYIYSNLHTRITIDILSEYAGVSQSYLSKIFKKETGKTVSEYIAFQKLETAKNMLKNSDYTCSEIALILAYPSQSYFTECFRKEVGVTPQKFRMV